MNLSWPYSKKRKICAPSKPQKGPSVTGDDDDESDETPLTIPFPKLPSSTSVYNTMNHVYFNDDITEESCFALNKELRAVKMRLTLFAAAHGFPIDNMPIYLHLTTNGGSIHAAFSVVDCIKTLGFPVYTIVDGFVASAGTLISIAGAKRYIMPNAYMLIHELRSGVWGKMSSIEEEYGNLKKIMEHINSYYESHTKMNKRALDKMLTKDIIWNAQECISKGLVDELHA